MRKNVEHGHLRVFVFATALRRCGLPVRLGTMLEFFESGWPSPGADGSFTTDNLKGCERAKLPPLHFWPVAIGQSLVGVEFDVNSS